MKKTKKKSISQLKKQADSLFSLYIRHRDKGVCITCGVKKDIKEMQNGHYMSRAHLNTRYDEENCHGQCCACNVFKNGNIPVYTIRLMEKYGDGIIKELYRRSQVIRPFKRIDYEDLIGIYREKLKIIK